VILHRSVDSEAKQKHRFELIGRVKKDYPNVYIAVAGGIEPDTAPEALKEGADILIVGRYITQSKDVERSAEQFINLLGEDIDLKRVHVE